MGTARAVKEGYELLELEEAVKYDHGCWIRFMKYPSVTPEVVDAGAKGKAPPAKGGKGGPAAGADENKPCFGKAWLSFSDLTKPGATWTKQRVYLQTCPPMVKKTNEEGIEVEVEDTTYEKVFEDAKTYVHIKFSVNQPIVPVAADQKQPTPADIIPVKQFVTWPYSKDPCDDFGKQVTLAVESLAKEFFNMFKNQMLQLQKDTTLTEKELDEKFDDMKKEFFYEINT